MIMSTQRSMAVRFQEETGADEVECRKMAMVMEEVRNRLIKAKANKRKLTITMEECEAEQPNSANKRGRTIG